MKGKYKGKNMNKLNNVDSFEGAISTGELIGKKVTDSKGKQIGKVGELLINFDDLCLKGIVVKRGLISSDLFIKRSSIKNLNKDGIDLLPAPIIESTKIKVFDDKGKYLGLVKSIKQFGDSTKIISISIEQEIKNQMKK